MSEKWENFLKNLGEWRGSFTQFSLQGKQLSSTNSIINLDGFDNNQVVRFRVRRFGEGNYNTPPTQDNQQEYRSLGQQIVLFGTGAFSKGSFQVSPISEFGAEYGFVATDRRLRFVQLYTKQGDFQGLTLIREFRAGTNALERPALTLDQLLGTWEGQAETQYADLRNPTQCVTRLKIEKNGNRQIRQSLEFEGQSVTSTARIEGNQLLFGGGVDRVVTLLPDGASSNIPLKISSRQLFFVETGWLISPTERQRLIRHYDDKGAWTGSTHVREQKIS
ncbi:MAG: DUF3598 family protein [Cyanobacteria bacterium P01_H01_bin.15]